jgi:dihydrofolate reductase
VITRQKDFTAADCIVVHSLEEALKQIPAEEKEAMIIGGAQIFEQVLPVTERIHLTRIHHSFEGDTFFPPLGDEWQTTWEEHHEPDEKNQYPYTFLTLEKKA